MSLETVVDTICLKCNELELLFPNLPFMQKAIPAWSKKKITEWTKLWETESAEYNPIYNYDRYEETEDNTTGTSNTEAINQVSAYNTSDFANRDKSTGTGSGTQNGKHSGHFYGNTGTSTYQQLIQSERETSIFSTYDTIAEEFKEEFCIMVY